MTAEFDEADLARLVEQELAKARAAPSRADKAVHLNRAAELATAREQAAHARGGVPISG